MANKTKIPPLCQTITEAFLLRSNSLENKTAVICKEAGKWVNLTYGDLARKVIDLSTGLIKLGLNKGDKVAILSENRVEYYIIDLAVISCGGIVVPLYCNCAPAQIEYIINDCKAKFLFFSPDERISQKIFKIKGEIDSTIPLIPLASREDLNSPKTVTNLIESGSKTPSKEEFFRRVKFLNKEDLATIIYTSGTQGEPKGVMLSHSNILANVKGALEVLPIDENSLTLSLLPLSHALERTGNFYTFLLQGATIAICDNLNSLSKTLKEISPTHIIGVPKLFESIHQHILKEINKKSAFKRKIFDIGLKSAVGVFKANSSKKRPPLSKKLLLKTIDPLALKKIREALGGKLKLLISGGSPMPVYLGEFFNSIGIPIVEGYGLTEASPVVSCNTLERNKLGSVGFPISGVGIKIAEDGEILVKGPNVMKGYYNNEKATNEVIDSDGWLHTGDIGSVDEEGFLTITGRKSDIIITTGGKRISPLNIEAKILSNPFIKQAVVLGDGKDYLSALIVPDREKYEADDLQNKDPIDINAFIDTHIKEVNSALSNCEKIRKYKILDREFSIDDGELTPTYKIRRSIIEQKYTDIIKDMYA